MQRELRAENVLGMVSVAVLKTKRDDEILKDNSDDLLTTPGVDIFKTPSGVQILGDLDNIQS